MCKSKRHIKAFTLTELTIVIAIVLLLTAVVRPSLQSGQITSKRTLCQYNLRNIVLAAEAYCSDNGDRHLAGPSSSGKSFWMTDNWSQPLSAYLIDKNTFICPSIDESNQSEPVGSYVYSMSFFHSSETINTITTSNETLSHSLSVVAQSKESVRYPDSKIMFGEWHSNHALNDDEAGWWNWSGKRNFVFADGHSAFIEASRISQANDNLPDANVTIDGIKGSDYN